MSGFNETSTAPFGPDSTPTATQTQTILTTHIPGPRLLLDT